MRILICDDETYVREETKETVMTVYPEAEIFATGNVGGALTYAKTESPDVALLDIEMPGMSGLELAKELKDIYPDINIIFVTAYSQYAVDAFQMYASGYLLKPLTTENVKRAFENLRTPIQYDKGKLVVRCFGNFEVFFNGKALAFKRARAKEIFAYLVDLKGATANTGELCAVLWEDSVEIEKNRHYLRNLIADIKKTLGACGMGEAFIAKRNSFAVNPKCLDCDYYRFLQQDPAAVGSYRGEYMKQYSWAEFSFKPD